MAFLMRSFKIFRASLVAVYSLLFLSYPLSYLLMGSIRFSPALRCLTTSKSYAIFFKQYLCALGVSVLLALPLLVAVITFIYFKLALQNVLPEAQDWVVWGQNIFFIILAYFSISILYYFGTIEGKLTHFFSPGALMTLLLFICSTYLFGIYIDQFSNYNQLYGSIGALLIFMLYSWINSIVLLLGFELNATISRLKQEKI